jgi:hypothetical protein
MAMTGIKALQVLFQPLSINTLPLQAKTPEVSSPFNNQSRHNRQPNTQ